MPYPDSFILEIPLAQAEAAARFFDELLDKSMEGPLRDFADTLTGHVVMAKAQTSLGL